MGGLQQSMMQMTRSLAVLLLGAAVVAGPLAAQDRNKEQAADSGETPQAIGGGSGLVVGGIEVDVEGKSLSDARMNGWRAAQREAWPKLWARMSGEAPNTAPKLADGALDQMVSAIEIEHEELGGNHYVARLAVVFDRARTATYLGRFRTITSSPPLLVLPVLQDAGVRYAYEDNPWLSAWARMRAGETPMDYVRLQATPGDQLLLNAWQAERRYLLGWRNLAERYQVADVLIPEMVLDRSWAGGPLSALLIVRFGVSGIELGRVTLEEPSGDINALMDRAVREADTLYAAALRAGQLVPNSELLIEDVPLVDVGAGSPQIGGYTGMDAGEITDTVVRVAATSSAELADIERRLRGTAGVTSVRITSYAVGGETVMGVFSTAPLSSLRYALDVQGLRFANGMIRRRQPDEERLTPPAGMPDPVQTAPVEGEQQLIEEDQPAAGPATGA